MLRKISLALVIVGALVEVGCGSKAFPEERFNFTPKYRALVIPYHVGDTLRFTNNSHHVLRIVISGIDSLITNRKDGLMSPRPYKVISVHYGAPEFPRKFVYDSTFCFINIYPDNLEQSCYFSILNFRGSLDEKKDSLVTKFQPLKGNTFTNCYIIRNDAEDLGKSEFDFEYISVQQSKGIVALKSYKGDWWVRQE